MTRPTNQALERYYFEQFKSHYALPDGEITFTDKPDVIIRGPQTIGIEMANLYLVPGSEFRSEQIQRQWRLQVLKLAQKVYLKRGGRQIELSVDFNPSHPIQDIESLANKLATLATEAEPHPTGQLRRAAFAHIPELRFVYYNAREYANAKWRSVQVYRVPDLSPERVRDLVTDKTKKVDNYQVCDLYWLLLVVDLMDRAQDQDIAWPPGEIVDKGPFERVLIYKPQQGQVTHVPHNDG